MGRPLGLPGGLPLLALRLLRRLLGTRVTIASARSFVLSLISTGSTLICFLMPSAMLSTLAIESEVFRLGITFPRFDMRHGG